MTRFPDVLLIGAMKSGTTGLYMDLAAHPNVYLPDDKEPHALSSDAVLGDEGQKSYDAIYRNASPDQICIDASTGYSKRPDIGGVATRACKLLRPDFKVIYMIRHPVERIVSQHYHEYSEGTVPSDVNQAVREYPRYINYSRYAYQLAPWIDAIGMDRIRVVRFEDYVEQREEVVQRTLEFLGLESNFVAVDRDKVYNKSQGKPVLNRFWRKIYSNEAYRRLVRPLLPVKFRLVLREAILPHAPAQPEQPSAETLSWLRHQLIDDAVKLQALLESPLPLWGDLVSETTGQCSSTL